MTDKLVCGVSTFGDAFDSVNELIDSSTSSRGGVVIAGDSITAQNTGTSAVLDSLENKGYFVVANHELDGAFNLLNNAGVGGERTDQILARMQVDVLDFNPDICIILAGTNDLVQAIPVSTITTNLTSIYTTLLNAGIIPILCTVPASGDFPTESDWDEVNLFISQYASDNNLRIVDFASSLIDASVPTFPYQIPDAMADATHPAKGGAKLMGDALAVVMLPLKPDPYTPPASNNNSKNLISNTLLTGTGGSLFGKATGVAPDYWTINDFTNDPNTVITCSLDDNLNYQTIRMIQSNSGVAISTTDAFTSINGVVAGQTIQGYIEFSIENGVNVSQFECRLRVRDSGNADLFEQRVLGRAESSAILSYTQKGIIRFPKLLLPVGTDDILLEILTKCESGIITISKPAIMVVG